MRLRICHHAYRVRRCAENDARGYGARDFFGIFARGVDFFGGIGYTDSMRRLVSSQEVFYGRIAETGRLIFFEVDEVLILFLPFVADIESDCKGHIIENDLVSEFIPILDVFVSGIFGLYRSVRIVWLCLSCVSVIFCGSKNVRHIIQRINF